jgi:hypothetical protein
MVEQPPLPLQSFCPLQPLFPDLQPPLPLQSFFPLQSCLLLSFSSETITLPACAVEALARTARAPVYSPAIAAQAIIIFVDFFMWFFEVSIPWGIHGSNRAPQWMNEGKISDGE